MNNNQIKLAVIAVILAAFMTVTAFRVSPAVGAAVTEDDAAATYKAKCAMCHSPKADKHYDPAKPDEEHVQAILKGKKGEKPPFMPGFEAKGMTEDQAKALAAYMRTLRTPAS